MDVLLPGQTNPTLNLGTVTPEDNGRKFKLVVSNGVLPNLTKTVTINVQGPGTPVISIVGGGALLPGTTISSDTSLPWLADGMQIAPASLSLELPWTVTPGAVITQPGSNALTVAGYHADAANYLNRVAIEDDESLEQPVQWVWDVFFRQMADTDHPTPTAASHKIALQAGTAIPMIGARTLPGALVPLYPGMPTPTNIGFVSGDYNRATGLKGDGSSKYIDSNTSFAFSDSTDHDRSIAVWMSEDVPYDADNADCVVGSFGGTSTRFPQLLILGSTRLRVIRLATNKSYDITDVAGFWGASVVVDQTDIRLNGNNTTVSVGNNLDANQGNILFFCRGAGSDISQTRLCIGQAGTAIDLAYMDTCLTTLQSSIAAALS